MHNGINTGTGNFDPHLTATVGDWPISPIDHWPVYPQPFVPTFPTGPQLPEPFPTFPALPMLPRHPDLDPNPDHPWLPGMWQVVNTPVVTVPTPVVVTSVQSLVARVPRGKGWRKSRPMEETNLARLGEYRSHHLFATARDYRVGVALAGPDLRGFCDGILDQGPVGSCTANALARALQISWRIRSADPAVRAALPSRRLLYWDSRIAEYDGIPTERLPASLADTGAELRLAFESTRQLGVTTEEICPYPATPEGHAEQPGAGLYARAYDCKGLQYAQVGEVGLARVNHVKDLLRAGCPVVIGMVVDEEFELNAGSVVTSVDQHNLLGGHAVCVVAVNPDNSVVIANSWGASWGSAGFGTLSAGLFGNDSIVQEVWALLAPPPAPLTLH